MRNYNWIIILFIGLSTTIMAQERGVASYYSDSFQGRKTASGEKYDKDKLTGAHKTLPFGTIVKVTRIDNGKSVKIRINDLGPYISGRIIDLSGKAAEILGLYQDGIANVVIETMGKSDTAPSPNEIIASTTTTTKTVSKRLPPTPTLKPNAKIKKLSTSKNAPTDNKLVERGNNQPMSYEKPIKVEVPTVSSSRPTVSAASNDLKLSTAGNLKTGNTYKIEVKKPTSGMYGVQVAAVTDMEGMMQLVTQYQAMWFDDIYVNVGTGKNGHPIYKVVIGAFAERSAANKYKSSLKTRKKLDGFVVELN